MKKVLILGSRFSSHQKTHILLYLATPLLIISVSLIIQSQSLNGFIVGILILLLCVFVISIAYARKGLVEKNGNLYRCIFLDRQLLIKKKINQKDKLDFSVLKFKKSQKMAWFSTARPDLGTGFDTFDITLLNKDHTKKDLMISVKKEEYADLVVEFLKKNSTLNHNSYQPKLSKKTRSIRKRNLRKS